MAPPPGTPAGPILHLPPQSIQQPYNQQFMSAPGLFHQNQNSFVQIPTQPMNYQAQMAKQTFRRPGSYVTAMIVNIMGIITSPFWCCSIPGLCFTLSKYETREKAVDKYRIAIWLGLCSLLGSPIGLIIYLWFELS